jgi:ABC-type glutathione transport system ATPase component
VGIARAILKRPSIFVFDEATSSLDTHTEREIQKSLEEASRGYTSITIAHRLSTIMNSDNILVLKQGEIVEQGTHNDLLQRPNGVYARMWQSQSENLAIQEKISELTKQVDSLIERPSADAARGGRGGRGGGRGGGGRGGGRGDGSARGGESAPSASRTSDEQFLKQLPNVAAAAKAIVAEHGVESVPISAKPIVAVSEDVAVPDVGAAARQVVLEVEQHQVDRAANAATAASASAIAAAAALSVSDQVAVQVEPVAETTITIKSDAPRSAKKSGSSLHFTVILCKSISLTFRFGLQQGVRQFRPKQPLTLASNNLF